MFNFKFLKWNQMFSSVQTNILEDRNSRNQNLFTCTCLILMLYGNAVHFLSTLSTTSNVSLMSVIEKDILFLFGIVVFVTLSLSVNSIRFKILKIYLFWFSLAPNYLLKRIVANYRDYRNVEGNAAFQTPQRRFRSGKFFSIT